MLFVTYFFMGRPDKTGTDNQCKKKTTKKGLHSDFIIGNFKKKNFMLRSVSLESTCTQVAAELDPSKINHEKKWCKFTSEMSKTGSVLIEF